MFIIFVFISVYLEVFDSQRLNLLELRIYKMWQVKIVFDKRKYLEKWVHVFCQILETPGSICGSPTLQADSLLSEDQESSILERSSLTRQILNHIQGNILMETQWSTVFIFEK